MYKQIDYGKQLSIYETLAIVPFKETVIWDVDILWYGLENYVKNSNQDSTCTVTVDINSKNEPSNLMFSHFFVKKT